MSEYQQLLLQGVLEVRLKCICAVLSKPAAVFISRNAAQESAQGLEV